jgi:hypothetical protein
MWRSLYEPLSSYERSVTGLLVSDLASIVSSPAEYIPCVSVRSYCGSLGIASWWSRGRSCGRTLRYQRHSFLSVASTSKNIMQAPANTSQTTPLHRLLKYIEVPIDANADYKNDVCCPRYPFNTTSITLAVALHQPRSYTYSR